MLTYCQRCVMPDTKPDLPFDADGVCGACRNFASRGEIDWVDRRRQLESILERYRSDAHWDCIVPVSGGKDSTFQVLKVLELGMNPLCVTATTCDLSEIGRRNIENLERLGVDHLTFTPNPRVRARLNRLGLTEVGDISWPEHVGIFTIPVQAAVSYEVPLIIWGENSQHEYGGPATAAETDVLDRRWLEEFGGLLGLRVEDLVSTYGFTSREVRPYHYPDDAELARFGVTGLFLGYFVPWDGQTNAVISQANGFETLPTTVEGSLVNYENLDNHQTGIHDYFKYLKFGFGRATDIACLHIRRGRLGRDDALQLVRELDGRFPWTYLGRSIDDILGKIDMKVEEFVEVCDRFTNRRIFEFENGTPVKDATGRPVLKQRGGA
jgi:N-acetyl sugar amidotransferase